MAKQRHQHSVAKQGNQQVTQTSYEEDDNLLPSAEELQKYQALDPEFVKWIQNRCDVEQKARLKFNDDRIKLVKNTSTKMFTIDIASIIAALSIGLCGMGLSYFLIQKGNVIAGSLFGGGSIFLFALRFLNFRKNTVSKEDN